jgi:hypothetical protein
MKVFYLRTLGIAASVAILIFAGNLLLNEQTSMEEMSSHIPIENVPDDVSEEMEMDREIVEKETIEFSTIEKSNANNTELAASERKDAKARINNESDENIAVKSSSSNNQIDIVNRSESPVIKGKVLDLETEKPIASVEIIAFDNNEKIKSNLNGEFEIPKNNFSSNAIVKSNLYEDKGVILNDKSENIIYMAPKLKSKAKNSQSDVDGLVADEVSGASKKMKSPKLSRAYTLGKSFYPKYGYENFEMWIDKNKNIPLEAFRKNFRGVIEIKFMINSDGTLSNFESDNKECDHCIDEAIRLLQKGTKWSTIPPGQEMKGDYKIVF